MSGGVPSLDEVSSWSTSALLLLSLAASSDAAASSRTSEKFLSVADISLHGLGIAALLTLPLALAATAGLLSESDSELIV